MRALKLGSDRGFTLVEMMIIAPIIIILIGTFIAAIVNLTGEVLSSRGSNVLTYNMQDALNRIEEDVKLSTTYLAVNSIDISSTKQGYGGTTSTGGTTNFTNVDKISSGGSSTSLILNTLATNANPISNNAGLVYLKDQPNSCSDIREYSKNKPMSLNVVYFVDSANTLWRRVIMPSNYTDTSQFCGSAPWQLPSCINGYTSGSLPFCKTNDEKLIEGVAPSDFTINYFTSASSTSPSTSAVDGSLANDARSTALQSTPTAEITITAKQTIAGRDIERTSSLRATRLDTNATSIAKEVPVTAAPASPVATSTVTDGHVVTFTWPQVATATSYQIDYQIKANGAACDTVTTGTWTTGSTNLPNSTRTFTISAGTHTDRVCARIRANNEAGNSSYRGSDTVIPLWAPLIMQGGWTDYGNGYSSAAYTKTKAGYVMLKGLVKKPSAATAGEVIGALPSDYAPAGGALIFGTQTYPNTWGRVDVWAGGHISFASGDSSWISLESIRFVAGSAPYTRTAPTLQNGWSNYGSGYSSASYAQDSTGRVSVQGLVKGGTMSDNTNIFALPAGLSSSLYMHVATHSSTTGQSLFGIGTSIQAKGRGNNAYYSLNGSYFPTSASVTWTNIALQNGWVAFNASSYPTAQYTQANDGVVHLRGLIKSGPSGTIGTLPSNLWPKERILLYSANSVEQARVDITNTGIISVNSSANGWLSLDGLSFIPGP